MSKKIYRLLINNKNQEFLISQDCLPVFLQQYKDWMNFQILDGGNLVLTAENSKITHYSGISIETELGNCLDGTGNLLRLYKVTQEVLSLETYWVYSTSEEQARIDFLDWSIFEPLEVSLVA